MKFLSLLVAFTAIFSGVEAAYNGFNIGATNADGSCKTTKQWATAFRRLRKLPHHHRQVRLYASSDCNTLARAVPAAKRTGTKILVGVWTQDDAHFAREKAALRRAIRKHGKKWMVGISVGSEDLYRGDTTPDKLAQQIYDVKGMVRAMGVRAPIVHVDTWNAWTNPGNAAVIRAVDVVGMDAYPYFQNKGIGRAKKSFFHSLKATRRAVHAVKPKVKVWVTETGHPWKGPNFGPSHPSAKNARKFWKKVGCTLFKNKIPTFWYAYSDWNADTAFGVFGKNGKIKYSTRC